MYGGKPAWHRQDLAYYLWWHTLDIEWKISVVLGTDEGAWRESPGLSRWDDYDPEGTATGIATVTNLE